jgi:type IV pilus assembly protein PilM
MLAVGLNLSSSRLSIVELLKSRNGFTVANMARAEIPPGCMVKGEVQDIEILSNSLKEIWRKNKISDRKVFIGIANQKVIAKEIRIPVINDDEIKNSIQYQISDFIPIPKNNIIYDYYVVEKGEDHSRIMLVGAMKSMVDDVVSSFKKAGLLAQAIDLNCFALYRTVNYIKGIEKDKDVKNKRTAFCVANLGVEISIIEMIQDYNLKYPRFTSTSIRSFIDEISKETKKDDKYCGEVLSKFDFKSLLLKKNEPEKKKKETGDSFLKPEEKESKNSGKDKDKVKDEPDSGKVKEIIKSTTDRFIGEIKLSVEHFLQENPKSSVGKIILTGEYIRNIDRYIEQEIEYKVEMLNINDYFPLKNIKIAAGYSEDGNYILDPVAIGMALRGLNQ